MRVWLAITAVAALAGAAVAQEVQGPATAASRPAASTLPADPARWNDALKKLTSEDFLTRQAGKKELAAAGVRDRPTLLALAAAAKDPEVKGQLYQCVEEMDERIAEHPPGVTLDLDNATLGETVKALAEATGLPLRAEGNDTAKSFTLHVSEQPFWEVWMALARQGSISQPYNGFRISNGSGLKKGVVTGPFVAFAQSISYQHSIDVQHAGGLDSPATLTLQYGVGIDPRMKIVMFSQPQLLSVMDDAGNELLDPPVANQPMQNGSQQSWTFQSSANLRTAAGGKKIVSAKGAMRLIIALSEARVEVPDMTAQVNVPIAVGGRTITFSQFELSGANSISLSASMSNRPNDNGQEMPMQVSLVNHDDQPIYSIQLSGGWGGGVGGNFKPPVKGIFSIPLKVQVVDVPFELKDLPLP